MNWKHDLRLSDLDPTDQLEFQCCHCKATSLLTVGDIYVRTKDAQLFIDEIETRSYCRKCKGRGARISQTFQKRMSGFTGGMA